MNVGSGNVVQLAPPTIPSRRPAVGAAGASSVEPWDFNRPAKMPRDQLRVLQMCLETFTRRLTTLLTSGLRQVSHVELVAVEQLPYDDYVTELGSSTLMAPITLEPLHGTTILQFPIRVGLVCVDHLLGGPGGEQPSRLPTEVETALLRQLVEQMLGVLRYALEPVVSVMPSLGTIEYNPQFVQAAGPTDPVLVARLRMSVGAEDSEASLCMPVVALAAALTTSPAHAANDPARGALRSVAAARLADTLGTTPVPVSVGFAPVQLDSARVLDLQVGDVLPLDHPVTAPLHLGIGDTCFGYALAGRSGERLAALVVPSPEDSP